MSVPILEVINLHAAYGARAAEMLNTEAQRELPSHDDEAEPVNSWVDTSREQEREDDRALRPADPQWPFVRSDSDREQQREELDLGLER